MEEDQSRRGGRRRRPPGLAKSSADQIGNSKFEAEGTTQGANANGHVNTHDGTAASAQQPARLKRVRKPKMNQPHDSAVPSGSLAQPPGLATSNSEPLTWQQESILNAAAPDFRPTRRGHGPPLPPPGDQISNNPSSDITQTAAAVAAALAPPKRKRRPKKTPQNQEKNNDKDEEEASHCLLCCNSMQLVSFGACGHQAACGPCCLRMRMCYGRIDCPLCKTDLPEVVISPYRRDIPEFSFFLNHPEAAARSRPGELGPGSILADRWQPGKRQPSSRLLHDLMRSTGLACSVCDSEGKNPFARASQLEGHLRDCHQRYLCGMCLREGRNFPLEAMIYKSEQEVKAHVASTHPRCDFCRGRSFFDGDALWAHMMDRHHRCTLCEPGAGGSDPWFSDVDALRSHLSGDHFACEDADCVSCLVAFRSAEELRRHHIERHSARMPRWNPAAARPLHLDIQFVRRPGSGGAGGGGGGAQGRRGGGGRGGRRRNHGAAGPEGVEHNGPVEFAHEMDSGFRIIDDDLGMLPEALMNQNDSSRRRGGGGGGHNSGGNFHQDVSSFGFSVRQREHPQEAFPSLAAATAEAVVDRIAAGSSAAVGPSSSRRPPPLVKHTVKCPCGRRVTYPVIEEGKEVPPLECDAVCRLEGRRRALADAFGVDDPQHHVSVFDRRSAVWSGALLEVAKRDPAWVHSVEKELGSFVAERELKRKVLNPMPRAQRALLHAMAQQYGLASVSTGAEPRRSVELFKTGNTAALPSRLLSKVAVTVSETEIAELLHAAEGHSVRFIEIAPTADLRYYLRRWESRYQIEWQGGTQATVTFEREDDQKEALDSFGGGIRGLFRLDRSWHPKTGVSTGEGHGSASGGGSGAAPWAGGGSSAQGTMQQSSGEGSGGGASQWRSVAAGQHPSASAGGVSSSLRNEEESGPAVPSGWAIIGGKKAVKPRVVARAGLGSHENTVSASALQFSALRVDDVNN